MYITSIAILVVTKITIYTLVTAEQQRTAMFVFAHHAKKRHQM
jgi:hypothetical protein